MDAADATRLANLRMAKYHVQLAVELCGIAAGRPGQAVYFHELGSDFVDAINLDIDGMVNAALDKATGQEWP